MTNVGNSSSFRAIFRHRFPTRFAISSRNQRQYLSLGSHPLATGQPLEGLALLDLLQEEPQLLAAVRVAQVVQQVGVYLRGNVGPVGWQRGAECLRDAAAAAVRAGCSVVVLRARGRARWRWLVLGAGRGVRNTPRHSPRRNNAYDGSRHPEISPPPAEDPREVAPVTSAAAKAARAAAARLGPQPVPAQRELDLALRCATTFLENSSRPEAVPVGLVCGDELR